MLDVPRAPPNGIIKEPANWVPLPDSAGSFLTQMTHPSVLHLGFCSGGGGYINPAAPKDPKFLGVLST